MDESQLIWLSGCHFRAKNTIIYQFSIQNFTFFYYFIHMKIRFKWWGGIYTIRGSSQTTLTSFWFFWPPTHLRWHVLTYEHWQKVDIFTLTTPSECTTETRFRYRETKLRSNFSIGIGVEFFFPKQNFFSKRFKISLSCFPLLRG